MLSAPQKTCALKYMTLKQTYVSCGICPLRSPSHVWHVWIWEIEHVHIVLFYSKSSSLHISAYCRAAYPYYSVQSEGQSFAQITERCLELDSTLLVQLKVPKKTWIIPLKSPQACPLFHFLSPSLRVVSSGHLRWLEFLPGRFLHVRLRRVILG